MVTEGRKTSEVRRVLLQGTHPFVAVVIRLNATRAPPIFLVETRRGAAHRGLRERCANPLELSLTPPLYDNNDNRDQKLPGSGVRRSTDRLPLLGWRSWR